MIPPGNGTPTSTPRPRSERRLTVRQKREAAALIDRMEPEDTLVFKFDGVNLREVVRGLKIAPGNVGA